MENRITYEDKLEVDSLIKEISFYNELFYSKDIYNINIAETLNQLEKNLINYKLKNVLICYNKVNSYLKETVSQHIGYSSKNEIIELKDIIERTKILCDDLIGKGLDNYQEEDVELTEKEKLKLQKQKADFRLKEIQEENAPYLSFSIGLSLILVSIIFFCIPTFFNTVALYHICGFMLVIGLYFLLNEIKIRQSLGWSGYTDKITSKRAFVALLQAIVYMIPLSILFYFFANVLIIKILFFIQIWFCSTIMINGVFLLIITNIINNKEHKFNIWNFILGIITIAGFVIQMLQLFEVL